jgi:hypothetical protein
MTRLEAAEGRRRRASLLEVWQRLGSAARTGAAREELDLIAQIERETLALSREHAGVHSLAAALWEKHTRTAACDAAPIALQDELAKHGSHATR